MSKWVFFSRPLTIESWIRPNEQSKPKPSCINFKVSEVYKYPHFIVTIPRSKGDSKSTFYYSGVRKNVWIKRRKPGATRGIQKSPFYHSFGHLTSTKWREGCENELQNSHFTSRQGPQVSLGQLHHQPQLQLWLVVAIKLQCMTMRVINLSQIFHPIPPMPSYFPWCLGCWQQGIHMVCQCVVEIGHGTCCSLSAEKINTFPQLPCPSCPCAG